MLKKWLVKQVFDMRIKFWAYFLFFLHFCFANELDDSLAIDAYVSTTIEEIKLSKESPFSSCKNYSIYSSFEYKKQEITQRWLLRQNTMLRVESFQLKAMIREK